MNSRSSSGSVSWYQVGRPWLHWPARSVASISRSSAFISGTASTRLARTDPWQAIDESSSSRRASTAPLPPWSRNSCSTARASVDASASTSGAGTALTAIVEGPMRDSENPRRSSSSACSSAVASSTGSAANVAGTSSGCVGRRPAYAPLSLS